MKKSMHLLGINDMSHGILGGLSKIPPEVDLVVSNPRSGLLAANLLFNNLNRPLTICGGQDWKFLHVTRPRAF